MTSINLTQLAQDPCSLLLARSRRGRWEHCRDAWGPSCRGTSADRNTQFCLPSVRSRCRELHRSRRFRRSTSWRDPAI